MYQVLLIDNLKSREKLKALPIWNEVSNFVIAAECEGILNAPEILKYKQIDLIIAEYLMDVPSNVESIKQFLNLTGIPPIILWSNETTYETARFALLHGIIDYVRKDISIEEWLETLNLATCKINKELNQNIPTYPLFPFDEIPYITKHFCSLQKEGLQHMIHILDHSLTILPMNNMTMNLKLKQFVIQISDMIYENHSWLEFFYSKNTIKNIQYYNSENLLDIATPIKEYFTELFQILKRFLIGEANTTIQRICFYIVTHVDDKITVPILSDYVYMNTSYMSALFKKVTGIPLIQYITMIKMERALYLLSNSGLTIHEISNQLFYSDPDYFSKVFKKYFGISPYKYLSKHTTLES